jgi:hypothetical protein
LTLKFKKIIIFPGLSHFFWEKLIQKKEIFMAYYVGAVAVVGAAYDYLRDSITHHPGEYTKTLAGIDVVIKEQATNWNAHKIKLTIIWSPENKANGISAEKHTWHASSSRKHCLKALEEKITNIYAKKAPKRS